MSSIGGQSGGISVGSNSDFVYALLKVITDPAAHQSALDRLVAQENAALTAETNLANARANIAADKESNKADRIRLDKAVADFAAEKKSILGKVDGFAKQEIALGAREDAVRALETKLKKDIAEFEASSAAKHDELNKRETDLRDAEANIAARSAELDNMKASLTAGQIDLDQKLAAIRALAK